MKPFAWSYSALTSFESCPRRYYQTKVSKEVIEPITEHITWGNQVHKALELRIKNLTPLPKSMEQYEKLVAKVFVDGGMVRAEQKMALTRDLVPTEFFAKDAWVRGVTDVTVTKNNSMFNGDWKTGKRDPDSAQLRLSAVLVMAHKPYITKSINAFIWLKTGEVDPETVSKEDIPKIWQEFMPRVTRMETAYTENKFPPKPSGLCRKWCACTSCEFHGK